MTSKCSKLKWNHEPRASSFTQSFKHFEVISTVDNSTDPGKLLSICFFTLTLTVLTSISVEISRKVAREKQPPSRHFYGNITLDQSAREKSLSYCRNTFWVPVPGVISKPLLEFTGLLPRDPVPEPGDEALSDSYDPWGDDNMLVGLL